MLTPQKTKTYHVFLASPGDMNAERQAVRDFFTDYNRSTARHRDLAFEVIDWEHHASTDIGRAQTLINTHTLKKHQHSLALVIGLLGQRFGTPTGEAESGTEEEFELALSFHRQHGWPEIKWFFREQWNPDFMPANAKAMTAAAKQMKKVEAFKKRLQDGDHQLL